MSKADTWQQQLDTMGSVRLGVSTRKIFWPLGIGYLIFVVLYATELQSGEVDGGEYGFAVIVGGLMLLAIGLTIRKLSGGNKAYVIERDAFILQNGTRIPWSEVEDVDVFRNMRGPDSVRLLVNEDAWQRFQASNGRGMRGMNSFNQALTRKRGIYLGGGIEGDSKELADWLRDTFVNPPADPRSDIW